MIKGAEFPLSKIFSSEFDYEIPFFQRPYAWTIEQTEELFSDLYSSFQRKESEYFLGSIVLVKQEGSPLSKVIDGQQRLTTLTILFALFTASMESEFDRFDYSRYVVEHGIPSQNIPNRPRLRLREKEQGFFKKYVQDMAFDKLFAPNLVCETDGQLNILNNAKTLSQLLEENFSTQDELKDFAKFVVNNCSLIVVTTPSEESACRIFSVLNSRGLNLIPTDIIKAEVIGRIEPSLQEKYNQKWEDIENGLGRDEFLALFSAIRMIFRKVKAQFTLQEEFIKSILVKFNSIDFIDNVLAPYADAYDVLRNCSYKHSDRTVEINDLLYWLNQSTQVDWIPVAMSYYVLHKNEPQRMYDFLVKLERLVAFMTLGSKWNVTRQLGRYGKVIMDVERDQPDLGGNIELSASEQADFIEFLQSDVYLTTPQKRRYLLLRLDSFVSDKAAHYDTKNFTVEHILPRTVKAGSDWEQTWPDPAEREQWLNKLGNLVPLSRKKNSQAQNFSFKEKKEKYFMNEGGVSSFVLTTQVINKEHWTPQIVAERQNELVDVLVKKWDLAEGIGYNVRTATVNAAPSEVLKVTFYCYSRGSDAHGRLNENGEFILEKGSRITSRGSTQTCPAVRAKMMEQYSHLIKDFVVQENIVFPSPYKALLFVVGAAIINSIKWKTKDGKTLKDFETYK